MSAMHGDCCLVDSDVIRPWPGGALTIDDLIYLSLNESLIPFYTLHKIRPDSVNSEETH
jgi:hypothetical protein